MRASVLHGVEDLRFEEVPDPEPGPGQVALRPAHNGICGSDLHLYFASGVPTPTVLGHEFSGTVVALGDGVTNVAVGDHIAIRPIDACGHCHQCVEGHTHRCLAVRFIGCNVAGGGLAERSVVPSFTAFKVPDNVSLTHAAVVEPMSVSFNGIVHSGIEAGATAIVLGGGPIGIGVLLGLRAIGVTETVVVEPSAERRAIVAGLGAAEVLDPTTDDIVAAVRARTGNRGADAVFECAGVQATFAAAPTIVRPGGRVVVLAMYEQPVTFMPFELITKEVEVIGSMAYAPGVFERVIDLMAAGHYPTDGWVEHIAWDDVVSEGLEPLRRGRRAKVLVDLPR